MRTGSAERAGGGWAGAHRIQCDPSSFLTLPAQGLGTEWFRTAPQPLGGLNCSRDEQEAAARAPGLRLAQQGQQCPQPWGKQQLLSQQGKETGSTAPDRRTGAILGPCGSRNTRCQGLLTPSSNNLPGLNLSPALACPGNTSQPCVQAPGSHAGSSSELQPTAAR